MLLPIVAYGHPTLRKKSEDISPDYPDLEKFLADLTETMYVADGVGLAAPQVNRNIRIFVIDCNPFKERYPEAENVKGVFINPQILEQTGEEWMYNEGCLSVPGIHEDVSRKKTIKIRYTDENWVEQTKTYTGIVARVIQHEYDHLEGVVFTDRLSSMRKLLLKGRLTDITKGDVDVDYKMIFPAKSKKR
ncbi:Peptide deformylase [bioreactor metagenome]|uniref:Peptide deformylase n=1 Tax=bioreactor metagenome TaxID=1076179 RepID=A0A644XYJ0_9ZZZZ